MKWMTVGKMIDTISEGEIAESRGARWRVTKTDVGDIAFVDTNNHMKIYSGTMDVEWHILPNFVSFEQAMFAYRFEKVAVTFHFEGSEYKFEYTPDPKQFREIFNDSIDLLNMVEGKWTIEND